MAAHWLICNLGKDEHIQNLYYGVLECGRTAEIVDLGQIAEIINTPSDEKKCVVVVGSIWANSALRQARPNWVGNFHNKETFKCSSYYSYWGSHLSQKTYAFLPLSEIKRRKDWVFDTFAIKDEVFLRPDSGEKEFPGDVIHRDRFESWYEDLAPRLEWSNSYNGTPVGEGILSIVSSPVDLRREFRLIVADKKVVASSLYRVVRHVCQEPIEAGDEERLRVFAENVLQSSPKSLPPFHGFDIAEDSNGRLSIMEIGCFCCSGLYQCDRAKIALGVSESAEKEFERMFGN